jgi:hypothetical protein
MFKAENVWSVAFRSQLLLDSTKPLLVLTSQAFVRHHHDQRTKSVFLTREPINSFS